MCGIIGYVGAENASEIITNGLKRLEYRGYDSVGIAVKDSVIEIRKDKGIVEDVSTSLQFTSVKGNLGVGHSRWATHGIPSKRNAHPHSSTDNKVVLVHNGVIENYMKLKAELENKGHKFNSDTDSEVIAHLIEENLGALAPFDAFLHSLRQLEGSFAVAALFRDEDRLFVARKNSPLVIGIGKGEMFCASDIPAMLEYTNIFIPLEDEDAGILSKEGYQLYNLEGKPISRNTIKVDWDAKKAEKGGYPHFMLKEIHEQPEVLPQSLATDVSSARNLLMGYDKVDVVSCGTSYHSALILQFLLEKYLNKRAKAEIASEYTFNSNPDASTLVLAISQSGETADVLQAIKYAKAKGAKVLSITNVVASSITRMSDEVIFMNSGPEIGVAATKTFTSQLAVIYKLVFPDKDLSVIPRIVKDALKDEEKIKETAKTLTNNPNIFFIGRALSYPIAKEGALKLKEISYLHAEAYPGGELKHGPLSLIDEGVPVIALAPNDGTAGKMAGNIKEVDARGARTLVLTDSPELKTNSGLIIPIQKTDPLFYPFAMIVPLQLLAYHVSVLRGIDPDKPKNLAKAVTVE